jgi:hypothetical protein
MGTSSITKDRFSLAALVAHEDLRIGEFVTVLNEIVEFPTFLWCDAAASAPDEMVRVRCRADDGGMPLKIRAICLPFVYARSPYGVTQTLDIRQVQLVRLKRRYAKLVWKDLRKLRSKNKRYMKGK